MDRKISGFTVIELITVIAIVAILLAIGVPQFTKWKNRKSLEKDLLKIKSTLEKAKITAFSQKKDLRVVITGSSVCITENTTATDCSNYIDISELSNTFESKQFDVSKRGYFETKDSVKSTVNTDYTYNCVVVSTFRVKLDKCN